MGWQAVQARAHVIRSSAVRHTPLRAGPLAAASPSAPCEGPHLSCHGGTCSLGAPVSCSVWMHSSPRWVSWADGLNLSWI